MSKSRAPRLSLETLKDRRTEFTVLLALASRLAQMEALRKEKIVNTPFVALEALSAFVGAKIAGHDDQDVRKTWPEEWGPNTVEVPLALLQALGEVWLQYRDHENVRTLGEVFQVEGRGQGKHRMSQKFDTLDRQRRWANEVEIEYLLATATDKPITLADATQNVADAHGISFESVQAAHRKYKSETRLALQDFGILEQRG